VVQELQIKVLLVVMVGQLRILVQVEEEVEVLVLLELLAQLVQEEMVELV
jgi:hypothetical protein